MWIYMRGRGAGHESERGGELKVFALLKIELNGKWFALCRTTQKSFYTLRAFFFFFFGFAISPLFLFTHSLHCYSLLLLQLLIRACFTHTHPHTPTPIDTKIEGLTGKRPDFGVKRNVSICE